MTTALKLWLLQCVILDEAIFTLYLHEHRAPHSHINTILSTKYEGSCPANQWAIRNTPHWIVVGSVHVAEELAVVVGCVHESPRLSERPDTLHAGSHPELQAVVDGRRRREIVVIQE